MSNQQLADALRQFLARVDEWIVNDGFFTSTSREFSGRTGVGKLPIPGTENVGREMMRLQREGFQIANEAANLGKAVAAEMDANGAPSKCVREIVYYAERGGGVPAMRPEWKDIKVELEGNMSRLTTNGDAKKVERSECVSALDKMPETVLISAPEIAKKLGLDKQKSNALAKALGLWRGKHPEETGGGWTGNPDGPPRGPKFLFRWRAVREICIGYV